MNSLIIFVIKVALFLISFYLVYLVLLSRDTRYGRNRSFILTALILSLILPTITIQTSRPLDIQYLGKMLDEVFISAKADESISTGLWFGSLDTVQAIFTIYVIGVALFILKLITNLANLLFLIARHRKEGSRIIRFHSFNTSGFSAMGYIFMNSRLNSNEVDEIIKHEQNHLRKHHFIDIIFIEIVKSFQWFNPAVYMLDRSLRAIHEYQADHECLCSGITIASYQNLLLNQVFRTKAFNLTNSFSNPSMIRKRMVMMTRRPTPSLANLKLLLAVPAAGIISLAISAYTEIPDYSGNNNISDTRRPAENSEILLTEPFTVVEEMPVFTGGDAALLRYLAENTVYPENAKEKGIQGRVIVRFCITEKGTISRVSVLNSVDPELDAEALRVVKTLPAFIPAKNGGKAVPVWYMVPLTFTLR
ncbi:MAG TPA: M56 family metallopeptidase [Bacteroidales bacterium]|nr:M56 family metallopeptidase [Bacteroidales bacterium]